MKIETLNTDILILGAGGAGLMAALHAQTHAPNLDITVVVKGMLGQSGCTRMVQGGYNAVLNPADSFERHFADTIRGGAFLNDQELAWLLVTQAPKRVIELENRVGCMFDRNTDGTVHQKPFAGQSFDRTVHRGDLTGIEIMSNLRDYILESPIRVLEETRGLELFRVGDCITGALLLESRTGTFVAVTARAVLLATGGGARMYRISSPSLEKSGDGMAMAWRAGAAFSDTEMLQFHPTGLLVGKSIATGGLLEEGLRGAGAWLINGLGERYMERYDPKLERATRDVVSRSSYIEIMAGRGSPHGGVWIDARHMGEKFLLENFPGMVERCADNGFDMLHDRIEVSPSAHFQMGGVHIDLECRSSIEGLFAAGEDAAGVHGANRLGGNGVADSIVFGAHAGDVMSQSLPPHVRVQVSEAEIREMCEQWSAPLRSTGGEHPNTLRREVENLMWEKVGLVRNGADLSAALDELAAIGERAARQSANPQIAFNLEWNEALDVMNICTNAQLVARGALLRKESRGSHFRSDFPKPNPEWLKRIRLVKNEDDVDVSYLPVKFTRMTPPELEPAEAVAASRT
jgi:succinate dehydrogenase / fumarate reductase flavoprotein subunit/fumarate reductase flavoprotein subunit